MNESVIVMIDILKKSFKGELLKIKEYEKGCWINLASPKKEEIEHISKLSGVPRDFLSSALDDDEKPRYEIEGNARLFIFNVPVYAKGKSIRTYPISIIITKDYFITSSLNNVDILNDFFSGKIRNFSTGKRTRLMLQILSRIHSKFIHSLDKMEKELNALEKNLVSSLKNEEIIKTLSLRRTLSYFQRAVVSNGTVLNIIINGKVVKLFEEDVDLLEDIIVENKQCIEMVSIFNNIIIGMSDAYTSIISNNLSTVMKILASITIILSVPTLISSFFGMNVLLPFQTNPFAYFIILMVSLLSMMVIFFIFLRKKWI